MASSPRVVAELGRPETPDETAARKAESSRIYRSSQTFRNLIAALVITVAVVAVVYFGVPRGSLDEPLPADVAAIAEEASSAYGRTILVPDVPDAWRANTAGVEGGTWRVVYAPTSGFVRVAQGFDADEAWITRTLGAYAPTGEVRVDGIAWDEYKIPASSEAGNVTYALATEAGSDIVLIYGSTSAETAAVAASGVADQIRNLREETP